MFAAGKTAAVSGAGPDDKFNYVTMLLHGDGTNGAQNNTFLDSGPNTLSITRNGNTTQGSFSPYGSNWSNYFNGTNAYLTPPASSVVLGSSDFTVEYWLFASNNNSHLNSASTAGGSFTFLVSSNADFYYGNGTSWENNIPFTSGTLAQNTWHHIAMTRQSSTMRLFLNGVLQGSASVSVSIPSNYWQIGAQTRNSVYLNGYISNFRIVSGTALYTSNFTPSTTPLTAVSGTSLLTCQSNRFIDNSASPLTIATSGLPSVQRFNPFGASAAYSTSVISGSGYFDGTGDYLSTPNVSALQPGTSTNPFCIECWVYPTNTPASDIAILGNFKVTSYPTNTDGFDILQSSSNQVSFRWGYPNYADSGVSAGMTLYAWNHIAVCRNSSGSMSCYLNGTRFFNTSTNTSITNATASSFWVGWAGSLSGSTINPFLGYISNARLVKGSTPYDPTSSTLTVPTAPLTAITNTSLLTSMTNGAIFDNAMMNDLETVGNAQISTSVVKYGTGSMAFDGTGDYLSTRSTPNLAFGSGDFTIECWVYASSLGSYNAVFAQFPVNGGSASNSYVLEAVSPDMQFYWIEGTTLYGPATLGTVTTGTWIHYAVCRSGNTLYPFKNGVLGTTISITQTLNSPTSAITVGGEVAGGGYWNGYIDDLRITKGFARYTATFTPPTSALSDTGPY